MPPLVRVAKMNHDVEHGSTVLSSRIGESCAASVEFMSENVDEVEKAGERADTMINRGTAGLNLKIAANAVRSAQEPQGICLSTITVHSLHSRKHFPIQKGRGSSDDDGAGVIQTLVCHSKRNVQDDAKSSERALSGLT